MLDSLSFVIPKQIDLDIIPNRTIKIHDTSGMILYYVGNIGPLTIIVNPNKRNTTVRGCI